MILAASHDRTASPALVQIGALVTILGGAGNFLNYYCSLPEEEAAATRHFEPGALEYESSYESIVDEEEGVNAPPPLQEIPAARADDASDAGEMEYVDDSIWEDDARGVMGEEEDFI